MTDLSSLIARLEAAGGPDRELDCHLWVAAQGGDARMNYVESESKCFVWERGIDGMWIRGVVNFRAVPSYTSSIDAAVSLAERVLPGANRTIRKRFRTTNGLISGHVYDAHVSGGDVCEGPNEAIALVLATVRALQQKGSSNA